MKLSLSKLAIVTDGTLVSTDAIVHNMGIDARTLKDKSLFIAIRGEQWDGHDFVLQAKAAGATALLVDHPVDCDLPQLIVTNTKLALGLIAGFLRREYTLPVIAITGSCGKTTTKSLIASVLSQKGSVLATQGTLNNDIGVPLTLLQLKPKHDFAVIEMGANHPQEIAYLTQMVKPTIGVITNAAPVHLEGFGSLQGVANAKAELYQHLLVDGLAILNIDDAQQMYWRSVIGARAYLTFGLNPSADVSASEVRLDNGGHLHFQLHHAGESYPIQLPLLGLHNIHNALAAAAVGFSSGLSMKHVRKGLEKVDHLPKRMNRFKGIHDSTLIDDSYNANPTAFKVAIKLLMQLKTTNDALLIMGDMAELGAQAHEFHAEIGLFAKNAGLSQLLTVGPLSAAAANAFGDGALHFEHQEQLIAHAQQNLKVGSTILIKGSRSARMENIVTALTEPFTSRDPLHVHH